jgi:predicted nucleic acid-binding protein
VESKKDPCATALDASVIVAGLLSSHEHHKPAAAALAALLAEPGDVILPLHALVEAYSVMTRLPSPHRLSVKNALAVLERTLRQRTIVVGLDGEEAWVLIEGLTQRQIAGATSYDGMIAACARKGGAQRILTFNRAHFERLADAGLEVVVPGFEK